MGPVLRWPRGGPGGVRTRGLNGVRGVIVRERRDLVLLGGEASAIVNVIAATSTELASLTPEARAAEIAGLQTEPLRVARRAE